MHGIVCRIKRHHCVSSSSSLSSPYLCRDAAHKTTAKHCVTLWIRSWHVRTVYKTSTCKMTQTSNGKVISRIKFSLQMERNTKLTFCHAMVNAHESWWMNMVGISLTTGFNIHDGFSHLPNNNKFDTQIGMVHENSTRRQVLWSRDWHSQTTQHNTPNQRSIGNWLETNQNTTFAVEKRKKRKTKTPPSHAEWMAQEGKKERSEERTHARYAFADFCIHKTVCYITLANAIYTRNGTVCVLARNWKCISIWPDVATHCTICT